MSATIFYHRDSLNMGYAFAKGVLQFRNGFLITHDETVKAFFRNHADYGKQEDGAILFESDKPISIKRTAEEKEPDRSQPKQWQPTGVQNMFATDGMYFVCDKDGTRHLTLAGMLSYIKDTHGEEYFRAMKVLRTEPKVRRFGTAPEAPKPASITAAEEEMTTPPCVGPYPKRSVMNPAEPLPSVKVQPGVGTVEMDTAIRKAP
jgi:hypothetical protein